MHVLHHLLDQITLFFSYSSRPAFLEGLKDKEVKITSNISTPMMLLLPNLDCAAVKTR